MPDILRVMTWNIGYAKLEGGNWMDAIAATIRAQDPHVLLVQEIKRRWGLNQPTDLSSKTGLPHVHFANDGHLNLDEVGNAILSKFPLHSKQRLVFGPRIDEDRGWSEPTIAAAGTTINGVRHWLYSSHPRNERENWLQCAQAIVNSINKQSAVDGGFVGADMNTPPYADAIKTLETVMTDTLKARPDPNACYYFHREPIDYVFSLGSWAVTEVRHRCAGDGTPGSPYISDHPWQLAILKWTRQTSQVPVPDVREMAKRDAETEVRAVGLVPARAGGSAAPGAWVYRQSPTPGTVVNVGSTVSLTFSDGPIP